jgi:hypothetical protein
MLHPNSCPLLFQNLPLLATAPWVQMPTIVQSPDDEQKHQLERLLQQTLAGLLTKKIPSL